MNNKVIFKIFAGILIVIAIAGAVTYYNEFIKYYYSISYIFKDQKALINYGIPIILTVILIIFNVIILLLIEKKPKVAGILGILNVIPAFFCLPIIWLAVSILMALDGIKLIKES